MGEKPPRLNAREITQTLQRHGFLLVSQKGSYQKWRHPDSGKQVIVSYHKGKQLPIGTLRSIIDGSGIPEEDFRR